MPLPLRTHPQINYSSPPPPPTRQHSFENLFSPTAEIDGGNYDLLYQNSVRKSEDDLEH